MAKEVIFAEQELEFAPEDGFSLAVIPGSAFDLGEGENYGVTWGAETHTVTAKRYTDAELTVVWLGNGSFLQVDDDTGEPFLIFVSPAGLFGDEEITMFLCREDAVTSRTVAIYKEAESGFGVILKDRDGSDVIYPTHTIRLKTSDGAIKRFISADAVPKSVETTVELDFSESDAMEVIPENGTVFFQVIVTRPTELIPENIAKDIEIAGVVGTHEGGIPSDSFRTVTFRNYDGTVLFTRDVLVGDDCPEPVLYGRLDTPVKTENGEGMTWTGWSRTKGGVASTDALSNITENTTLYACFKWSGTLDNISWADISAASLAGTASSKFKVGDTKAVNFINDDGTVTPMLFAIAGFNLHRNTSGTKDNSITFIQKGYRKMNLATTNGGVKIDEVCYNTLESDLKAVIRQTRITGGTTYNGSSVSSASNNMYLFCPEMTNITSSLCGPNGETGPILRDNNKNYLVARRYTNNYDSSKFPLFDGMSTAEIAQFLGLTESGREIYTRSRLYVSSNGTNMSFAARICYSEIYTLYEWATLSASGSMALCFRV